MVSAALSVILVLMTGVAVHTQQMNVLNMFPEMKTLSDRVNALDKSVADNTNNIAAMKPLKDYIDKRNPTTAFSAGFVESRHIPRNTIMDFDRIITNVGNAYDKNSGVFTAKHAGIYFFSVHLVQTCPGTPYFCFPQIWHNDVAKQGGFTNVNGDNFEAVTINIVLNLSAGDRVYVKSSPTSEKTVLPDKLVAGAYFNSFSGFLI